jgi:hypothetical protein
LGEWFEVNVDVKSEWGQGLGEKLKEVIVGTLNAESLTTDESLMHPRGLL